MFDKLFTSSKAAARYSGCPLLAERIGYLAHCAAQGSTRSVERSLKTAITRPAVSQFVPPQPAPTFQRRGVGRDGVLVVGVSTGGPRTGWPGEARSRPTGGQADAQRAAAGHEHSSRIQGRSGSQAASLSPRRSRRR